MSRAEDRYLEHFQDGRLRDCSSKEAFLLAYHQAEKDLSDISWIKKVSGVKDMSRAKEEALKAYPPRSIAANYDTINRRDAFEYGYLKAEKDVAESFARIIRGNLSMIDEKVQVKFEQLYTDITGEKMYKGFKD